MITLLVAYAHSVFATPGLFRATVVFGAWGPGIAVFVLVTPLVGLGLEFKPSKKLRAARIGGAVLGALLLTLRRRRSRPRPTRRRCPAWAEAAAHRRAGRRPALAMLEALHSAGSRDDEPPRRTRQRRVRLVDSLTQLPTRVYFEDRLAAAATKADANASRLALLFIDLDGFKPVNDTYGHSIGDIVLEQVGQRLKAMSRGKDVVARVGGDEFLLLLSNVHDARRQWRRSPTRLIQGLVAAVRGRGPRGDDLVLGRHRHLPRRLQPRQADRPRRRGDVRVQARRRLQPLLLFDGDGRRRRGPVRRCCATCARRVAAKEFELFYQPKIDSQERQGHRGRGAAALEAPDPRHAPAQHLHPDRRALRPDRRARQLGDRGRLPAKPRLARQGPADARRDQPLGAPDAPGRHRRAHHRRARRSTRSTRRC